MSRKTSARKTDRRVRRTREALGDALLALIQEKPFESITVQQVLDRAKIGRSTFYAHFRDKDDLFLSDVEDFLGQVSTALSRKKEASNRVAAVREFFSHVGGMRALHVALVAADKSRDFVELGQGHFARGIDQRLSELPLSRDMERKSRTAIAHALAGALFSLLAWWLAHESLATPAEVDELFHRMVWSGVANRSGKYLTG